ncbi:MAG: hypothetical protein GX025_04100 [Clostridiales bacterium]|nr:hypothetical protein [Clostridiales bacterium]
MKKLAFCLLSFFMVLASVHMPAAAISVNDFSDVSPQSWYYSSVDFVIGKGMFNGTSSNTFSPSEGMTRGMFVTVLGRYAGVAASSGYQQGITIKSDVRLRSAPSTSSGISVLAVVPLNTRLDVLQSSIPDRQNPDYTWFQVIYNGINGYIRDDLMKIVENSFSDVPDNAYYSAYVQWAVSASIASGTGVGTFSPNRNITREEICSMLYNYAAYKNYKLTPSLPAQSFSDASRISPSYTAAVSALQRCGVINGYEDNTFRPSNGANRAEVSAMLMRFIDAISYKPVSEPSTDSAGNYIFGTEVPQKADAGDGYFSDACFIGHSLVVGMESYFSLPSADFYAFNGASAQTILTHDKFKLTTPIKDDEGKETSIGTLQQALSQKSYGKIYIMLGVNEIGSADYHQQSFYSNLKTLFELVRCEQPNSVIYLISLSPVTKSCSENRSDVNRDNSISYNKLIKQLCSEKKAYYLNVFDLLADSDGFLPVSGGSSDGIHLLPTQYRIVKEYLRSHTA